jgi:hypothetical protein
MDAVSGVNYVNGNFYRTKVVDNGDGTFGSTVFRTDAQGNNAVPIAGYGAAAGAPVAQVINTSNATAAEQQLLADPNSVLNKTRQQQTQSLEGDFFPTGSTPDQQTALSQAGGGSGNTASATGAPDQQGGSTPTNPQQAQPTSGGGGILMYPEDMKNTQDRIKFTVWEVKKAGLSAAPTSISINNPNDQEKDYSPKSDRGTVFLPIQSGISDQNTTSWGEGRLNEIERQLVETSLGAMDASKGFGQAGKDAIDKLYNGILAQKGFGGLARIALAEQAVGVNGLLPRVTGSVLNPNLELLFQGPTLRPFNFSFKLSPRSEGEANKVKQIIKFFKKNMSVRNADSNLFLKAPYVFGIEYQNGANKLHQSINKIKKCALQSCSVDYTPLNSYMTYQDSDATMVSYTISMQFQEIVPIYDTDYNEHPIGY